MGQTHHPPEPRTEGKSSPQQVALTAAGRGGEGAALGWTALLEVVVVVGRLRVAAQDQDPTLPAHSSGMC